ncbi:MAG: hypothetical protein ACTSWY_12290 [Promethearchaeota archaeon]
MCPITSIGVLLDSKLNISTAGIYNGSIITKVMDKSNSIIFSDSIEIQKDGIIISEGLKVGTNGKEASSLKGKFIFENSSQIHYSVRMDENIIKEFDNARFGANFPHMISKLNTGVLWNWPSANHTDFIRNEIINHPIGLLYNDSIIVADRLVVDNFNNSVFYDVFLIKRNTDSDSDEKISFKIEPLSFSYEPIFRINLHFLKYIIILGVEMLK